MLFTTMSDLSISYILSIKQLKYFFAPKIPLGGKFAQARFSEEAHA